MIIKSKINHFFNKDIYIPNVKELFIIAFLLGLLVYFELVLLNPWNENLPAPYDIAHLWTAYGIITSVSSLIVIIIIVLYRRGKEGLREKSWKIIGLLTGYLLLTTYIIIRYDIYYFSDTLPDDFSIWEAYINALVRVMEIGLFPLTLLGFWLANKSTTNVLSTSNQDRSGVDTCITVKSSSRGSGIKIKICDILYLKSDRNYVDIFYIKDSIEKRAVHRSSLSAMQEELHKYLFCRIHNSYLVRLSLISAPYTVNSTYVVRLASPKETTLPVSRTYLKAVREALTK